MSAPAVITIVAVVLIVLALVYYLVSTIFALRRINAGLDDAIAAVGEIVDKSKPVNEIVVHINAQLDAGVDALEGLLVKKAGLADALGLIDSVYPGGSVEGLRNFDTEDVTPPRIGEVYTKGTLTLARLGREAPIAAASPAGAEVLRNVEGGSLAARKLYPDVRQSAPQELPRSPVIGTDAPVQYEHRGDIGKPRKRRPARGDRDR